MRPVQIASAMRAFVLSVVLIAGCSGPAPAWEDHEEPTDFEPFSEVGKLDGVSPTFNRNLVIDDALLVGASAMAEPDVQAFFEATPYGTRSWLASATLPDGRTAAKAVIDVAKEFEIHPLALIVRMQCETSIVSKTAPPSQNLIDRALGCGCSDGSACAAQYRGLAKQLACGARTMRRWFDASVDATGQWRKGHARQTLDPTTVTPVNHATAALYAYTPWVSVGSGGNWLLWNVTKKYEQHARTHGLLHDGGGGGGTPTWWKPTPGTTWQIQLSSGTIDTSFAARAYDIDLFDTPQSTIDALHAAGKKVICYFSAGSHENWRSDQAQFPGAALGNPLDGWPGERWLDTRSQAVREIMKKRMDLAVQKRCDAVDPDNVDGYTNTPGFALTSATQLDYNEFLAAAAHSRGLAVGLKNDLDQIPPLVASFDFAVNEQCFQYSECDTLTPFITANKPVFGIEYGGPARATAVCSLANARNFDTLVKNLALDPARIACR